MDGDTFAEESAVLDELPVRATHRPDGAEAPAPEPAGPTEPREEPPPPETGDPTVDEATAEVAATAAEPLETRLAAYERAHRTLQDRLADVEG